MYLTFDGLGMVETKIDLDFISGRTDVYSVETFHSALVVRVANATLRAGADPNDTYPLFIYDQEIWESCESDRGIDAGPSDDLGAWTKEVAQFAWYVLQDEPNKKDQAFAYLDNNHWQYVDFDVLDDEIEENYLAEAPASPEEYARDHVADHGESVPDYIAEHVDWGALGEELLSDMEQYEWNGSTFLYTQ